MHPTTFHLGEVLSGAELIELLHEAEKQELATFFKHNASTTEMHVCLDFMPVLEKLDRVTQFEIKIMIIGVGAKANLFDNRLDSL